MTRLFFVLLAGLFGTALTLADPALAEDGYRIQAGDILRVEVLEDPTLNRSALVAPDGRISMPLAGGLRASGRTVEAVQADLVAKFAPNFATSPTVFVAVERLAERVAGNGAAAEADTINVYVMGEAAKPGKLAVEPGTTVMQFFAEMGGFSKFAATKRIQLRHTHGKSKAVTVYKLNYDAITAGTSTDGDTTLSDGDVIIVPQRKLFE